MNRNINFWLFAFIVLGTFSSGCHLERGKLYFDEVGLDPITLYKMAPLERTVYCLAEINSEVGPAFENMHATALEAVRDNPEQADWSELVCLSLSGEADTTQLRQTVNTLDLVLSVHPQQSHPVLGFRRITQQRVELYDLLHDKHLQIEILKQNNVEQEAIHDRFIKSNDQIRQEQERKIVELEEQVRKLKEVELLLHPIQ